MNSFSSSVINYLVGDGQEKQRKTITTNIKKKALDMLMICFFASV